MPRVPLFAPLLAGAASGDRLRASLGAMLGIAVTALVCVGIPYLWPAWPWLVAPIGASAVLVFAVPASPLAQPWPVIGGNVISALVGVLAAQLVPGPVAAAALAVSGAIMIMSLARCLHPPGGAAALTAVIGGPAVTGAGWSFAFVPVGLNSALLVVIALLFHRWSGHSYPHRPAPPSPAVAPTGIAFTTEDLDWALAELGETFDVDREDLEAIVRRVVAHAAERPTPPASLPS